MSIKANVSLTDVTAVKTIVTDLSEFGNKFDSGISCVEDLLRYIRNLSDKNNELSDNLQDSASVLSDKIENTENEISDYESELSQLNDELDDVESELAITDETIEMPTSGESTISVPNPKYTRLQAQASNLKRKIAVTEGKINRLQNKLNRMRRLKTQLNTLTSKCKENSVKLNEDNSKCRQVIADLTELKTDNAKKSDEANRLLETICGIIEEYQSLVVQYDESLAYDPLQKLAIESLISFGSMFISKIQNKTSGGEGNAKNSYKPQSEDDKLNDNAKSYRKDDKQTTDDNGKTYRIGDELKENNSFVRNGYIYTTDKQGRTISVSGKLTINEEGQANRKMSDSIKIIGKGYQKVTDDRGHLIGHQFNGPDSLENLVPQDAKINRGNYKRLEDHLAKLLKKDYDITVNIVSVYSQRSYRPDAIFYFYTVNDNAFTVLFPNEVTEE